MFSTPEDHASDNSSCDCSRCCGRGAWAWSSESDHLWSSEEERSIEGPNRDVDVGSGSGAMANQTAAMAGSGSGSGAMANQTADALQLLQDQNGTFHVMADSYQMELFGKVGVFPNRLIQGDWVQLQADRWSPPTFWHGLTLSQLHSILADGVWKFGLWKEETMTSPLALWVTTSRSAAIDRASAERGYAAQQGTPPSEWDCPVAIGLNLPDDLFGKGGHEELKNGVQIKRMLSRGRTQMPVQDLNIVEVNFCEPVYEMFRSLPGVWPLLIRKELVMCRC